MNSSNKAMFDKYSKYDYIDADVVSVDYHIKSKQEFDNLSGGVSWDFVGPICDFLHEHKDNQDVDGKTVYSSGAYHGLFIDDGVKNAFSLARMYCDYLKKYAKESSNYEMVESLCNSIKEHIEDLYKIVELDYIQRINNYIDKEKLIDSGVGK